MSAYKVNFAESRNGAPFVSERIYTVSDTHETNVSARDALKDLLAEYPQHERRFVSDNAFIVEYESLPTLAMFWVSSV